MITFLVPAALGLLAIAAAPPVVHLLTRRRAQVRPFPALALLARVQAGRARLSRLRERAVLSLRTIAIAACALAAAGALVHGSWSSTAGRPAVVVVDGSASMRQAGADGSSWSRARSAAGRLLESLRARPRAVVIAANPARRSSPRPVAELGAALALLAESEPGAGDGGAGEAIAAAVAMLGDDGDLYFVTDLARGSLGGIDPAALPKTVSFHLVDAGGGGANVAVVGLSCEPGVAIAGRPLTVQARVADYGPSAIDTRVRLQVGSHATLLDVHVPAGGSSTVSCQLTPESVGFLAVSAEVPSGDALADDDRRCGAIEVVSSLRALVVGDGDRNDAAGAIRPLAAALGAAGLDVRSTDGAGLAAEERRSDILVTAGIADAAAAAPAVRAHLQAGGAWVQVIVGDGDAAIATALAPIAPPFACGPRIDVSEQERGSMGLGQARLDHPLLAGFVGRESLLGEVVSYRYRLTPGGPAADAVPLLAYADGSLALAERPVGSGRWLELNCSSAAIDSTLSRSSVLAMLVARLPLALLPARAAELAREAGAALPVAAGIAYIGADGAAADAPVAVIDGQARLARPGLYRLSGGGLVAAAVPAPESDLRRLDPALVHLSAESVDRATSASGESPAWPWLLVLAALALVGESWLAGGARRSA